MTYPLGLVGMFLILYSANQIDHTQVHRYFDFGAFAVGWILFMLAVSDYSKHRDD